MAADPVVITALSQRDAKQAIEAVQRIEAGGLYRNVTATRLKDLLGLDAGVVITGEPDNQAIFAARSAGTIFQRNP